MINRIKYELWPPIKVQLRYWWWIIKYRGRKNIPPEIVFGALEGSVSRMTDNLEKAFRVGKSDMSPKELQEFNEVLDRAKKFERETLRFSRESQTRKN